MLPLNILIVDDERLSREYIRNMVRQFVPSATTWLAASGNEALPILEQESIDILYLDVKMTEMSGFELLEKIKNRNFELIFITAHSQYAINALKEGAFDYLLKPIKKVEFKDTLDRAIAHRKQVVGEREEKETLSIRISNVEMQLVNYINTLKEKNDIIENLEVDIEQLREFSGKEINEKLILLDQLQKNVILTEDDWNNFKEIFEKVYSSFFVSLRDKYSDLTQGEIRLLTLTKLKLTTKEMANILGISPETIRQTRWRLRKKIGLSEETDLDELVANF